MSIVYDIKLCYNQGTYSYMLVILFYILSVCIF